MTLGLFSFVITGASCDSIHVPRLMRTVRHLRSSQIWWRTRYFVERRLPQGLIRTPEDRPDARLILRDGFPSVPIFHRQGPVGTDAVDRLARGEFRHLNRTVSIGMDNPDWMHGGDHAGRLWSVTLHYHGWLYDLAEAAVHGDSRALPLLRHYLDHWLEHCRLRKIGPNNLVWNAFAIATRASWWVRALQLLRDHAVELPSDFLIAGSKVSSAKRTSCRDTSNGICGAITSCGMPWGWRGSAATSQVAAGSLVTFGDRDRRIADCRTGPRRRMHFERSPMYHIHVMEDVLSLALLLPDARVTSTLARCVRPHG